MASANGHYDQNLLAAAPAATKAQLQEGYNPDLLEQNRAKLSPSAPGTDPGHAYVSKEYGAIPARPLPFWRTRKGMIIIFVAAVVVIGAVVGGAVGGTSGKKKELSSNSTVSASEISGLFSSTTTPTPNTGPSHKGTATAAITGQPVASGQSSSSPPGQPASQPSQSLIPGLTFPAQPGGTTAPITSGGI